MAFVVVGYACSGWAAGVVGAWLELDPEANLCLGGMCDDCVGVSASQGCLIH